MYYIYMKISVGCAKESLEEVEEQSDIEADGDINSAMPPKSQMSLRHTVSQFMTIWNGPMTFTMRSKRLLDMLLKECDFVSSFVVRSVAS